MEITPRGPSGLERLCPPRRSRPITVAMPPITTAQSLIAASAALTSATTSGEITPDEAAALSTLFGNVAKAVETAEPAERLARLEQQIAANENSR
jgi:tRNA A37 threonylcarbamoyladenosine synthetase subunit TsaC/SUA5/YrdC